MSDKLEPGSGPSIGAPAPLFEIQIGGNQISLKDFKGHWIILFSHPEDLLPIFRTRTINYVLCKRRVKAIALGNRTSSDVISGRNFVKKYILRHSLTIVDDESRKIADAYGVCKQDPDCQDEAKGVFVIDPKGILRIKLFCASETERDFSEILKLVDALQNADRQRKNQPRLNRLRRHLSVVVKPKTAAEEG